MNDRGEIVYEARINSGREQIFSTVGGLLSPVGVSALRPSINNSGEVVWEQPLSNGNFAIFSNIRGQLTDGSFNADQPDIADDGVIVFRGINGPNGTGIYEIATVPGPIAGAGLPGLLAAGAAFIAWKRRRHLN